MTHTVFTNLTPQLPEIQIRLRKKANQIVTEQSEDVVLQELMAKSFMKNTHSNKMPGTDTMRTSYNE